jgi:hypothetical protein
MLKKTEFEVVNSSLLENLFEFVHVIVGADLNLGKKKLISACSIIIQGKELLQDSTREAFNGVNELNMRCAGITKIGRKDLSLLLLFN